MPMLVRLVKQGGHYVPERFVRAADFVNGLDEANNPEWKTVAYDETSGEIVVPNGSAGVAGNPNDRAGERRRNRVGQCGGMGEGEGMSDRPTRGTGPEVPSDAHRSELPTEKPGRKRPASAKHTKSARGKAEKISAHAAD